MKKFFTLFMATVVALSMYALPLSSKTTKGQVKQPTEVSQEKMARMEKMAAGLSAPSLERQAAKQTAMAKKKMPANASVTGKVRTDEEVVEYHYTEIAFGPTYYEDTGDWTIILTTDDEYSPAYGMMFQFDWYAPADSCYGTFTTEDFSQEYTFLNTPYSMGSIFFEEIEMTIGAKKVSDNLEVITVEAILKGGSDGFDTYPTYKLTVEQENIVAKGNVDIAIEDATLTQNEMGFVVAGKNEDIDFAVAVNSPYSIQGTYTNMSAFDLENTTVNYKGVALQALQMTLSVELGQTEDGRMAYISDIELLASDTIQYNISAVAPLPPPTDTLEVSCSNLKVDDSYVSWFGTIDLQASNDDYIIYGAWYAPYIEEGTYTGGDVNLSLVKQNTEAYEEVTSLTASLTVSLDENERWAIEGTMLGNDNVWYILHLSYYIPTPTDTVVVEFETSAKARFYPNFDNDLMLFNEDDVYYAALDVIGKAPGDTFTEENMDLMFTSLQKYNEEYDTKELIEIATIQNGLLEQVGDTTKLQADIYTFEGILYKVNLWHIPAIPTDTVTVEYDSVQFVNNLDYGYYNLLAYAPDSNSVMMLTIYAYSTEYMAGTFVNDGLFGKFGEGQYDIDASNSYFGVWDEEAYTYELFYMDKGEVTVVVDEEKNITLTGTVICENAVQYDVTMHSKYERPRIDYDTDGEAIDRTFIADTVVFADQAADYGMIQMLVISKEELDQFILAFMVPESDPDIVVPEGTYEINDSWEYGTVLAGTGVDYEGYPSPSYYSTLYLDEMDGYIYFDQLYFLVSGTVEVTKNEDGSIRVEIDAINSYEVPIHIVYDDGGATGIENIAVEDIVGTQKIMMDGQMMIIRNGKIYNVVGASMR